MTPPPTEDPEPLYEAAAAAHEQVTVAGAAYHAATKARGLAFLALKRSGQSLYKMANRLGLSSARVAQIVANAEKGENRE